MKASIYTEYGPPDVLRLAEVKTPTPGPDQVRVRVRAVSVGYGDVMVRNLRNFPLRDFNMPLPLWPAVRLMFGLRKPRVRILGSAFSGEIDAVGADVTRFAVGDAVFGYTGPRMGAGRADFVKALGADEVIDYRAADFTDADITGGDAPYDLIVDVYGRTPWSRCKRVLADDGVCLYVSFRTYRLVQMLWTRLTGGKRVVCRMASESPEALSRIRDLAEDGAITTEIDRVFPLERADDAHRHYEGPGRRAKVVIRV